MSGLIPISQTQIVLKNLSPDEVAAIEAGKGKRIKDYDRPSLLHRAANVVAQACVLRGQSLKGEDQNIVTNELCNELQTSFCTFTVEEIFEATRAWAIGKLSLSLTEDEKKREGVHVSVHNLCKAIWHWRDVVKRQALEKIEKEKEAKEKEVTEEEKRIGKELFKEQVLQEFNYWKEHGSIMHSGPSSRAWHAFLYLWFKERGYCLPNDEAKEIKDKADTMILRDRAVKAEHKRAHLEEIEERRKELARELALPVLFAKFVKHGIKLEDLWNGLK
jgi:hypothetical protein